MEGSSFRWNLLTSAFSRKAGRNEFFRALFSNIFFTLWWNTACPSVEHKLKKNKKDAFTPVWKIEAFKPRDRQTTEAVTCLEFPKKTLKGHWRCELNLFCPNFFPLAPLCRGGCSPTAWEELHTPAPEQGQPLPCTAPLPLWSGWGDHLVFQACFPLGFVSFPFFYFPQRSAKVSPPLWHTQEQGRKSHHLSKARKDDLCSHLWGMTVTVDLLSGLDYIW